MENGLFGIPNLDVYIVIGILLFFIIIETIGGFLHQSKRNFGDWIQEIGSYFILALLIKPLIVLLVLFVGDSIFPAVANFTNGWNLFLSMLAYVLIDDFLQYWYHRSAHEYPFLWKLHRPHHQAEEMGFFVSYRNAALYYVLMPNIWWIGLYTFFGGATAVALGLIAKQIIIISSHSTLQYDKWLYKFSWLNPIATMWERIFITPAFHHAHHGKSKIDGISDPNGNFGNMFSIWDQLFGTAQFTRSFPSQYGLENDTKDHWTEAYLYPIVKSKNKQSELSKEYTKEKTISFDPILIDVEKDKNYLYCQCGMSKSAPFCDGTHHGTKFKPLLFTPKRTGKVRLCNCKLTKNAPFCDESHLKP